MILGISFHVFLMGSPFSPYPEYLTTNPGSPVSPWGAAVNALRLQLLIKRLDNKRARELWPRSSTYTDCLEFYGGVAVPLGPRALGSRPNGGCVEALGATAWRRRGLILRTARMCHAPMR